MFLVVVTTTNSGVAAYSLMISQMRFSLLGFGDCFACSLFCSACRRSIFILSGIHFRAVGLLMPSSAAHLDTLPPGWARNHPSTLACRVGAPALLILGSSAVNFAILSTSCTCVFLIIARRRHSIQLFSSYLPCKITGNYRQNRVGSARWHISTLEPAKPPENRKSGG